ncbi:hypothetical protein SDJN03_15851, partial [Cucurbita argyrosperma subsp. sororia]
MHLALEPESKSKTESKSEYNSSLYQSESASESPFKEGNSTSTYKWTSQSVRLVIDYVFKAVLAFQFLCPNNVRSPCFRFFLSNLLSVPDSQLMPTMLWLQVALGFIPTPQCVARVIDLLRETMVPKERSDLSSKLRFRIPGRDLNEDSF